MHIDKETFAKESCFNNLAW